MQKKDIDIFFKELSHKVDSPLKIYLTGGIASWLMGGNRPTRDMDFAVKEARSWEKVDTALNETSQKTGVTIEYSEDISRWGMVGYSAFETKAALYKKFGKVTVYILEPTIWAVGKIHRSLPDDLADIEVVFRKQKTSLHRTIATWSQAFLESPASTEKGLFIKRVEFFLKTSGKKIWGKSFDASKAFTSFKRKAQLS